jgi:hypothetical protein
MTNVLYPVWHIPFVFLIDLKLMYYLLSKKYDFERIYYTHIVYIGFMIQKK